MNSMSLAAAAFCDHFGSNQKRGDSQWMDAFMTMTSAGTARYAAGTIDAGATRPIASEALNAIAASASNIAFQYTPSPPESTVPIAIDAIAYSATSCTGDSRRPRHATMASA